MVQLRLTGLVLRDVHLRSTKMSMFETELKDLFDQTFEPSSETDALRQAILNAHEQSLALLAKPAKPAKPAMPAEQTDEAEEVVEKKGSDFAKITGLVAALLAASQTPPDQTGVQHLLTDVGDTLVRLTKNFSKTAHKTATLYESQLSEQFPVDTQISMNDLVIRMKKAVSKAGIPSKSVHVTTSGLVYGLLSADDRVIMSEFYTELKKLKTQ